MRSKFLLFVSNAVYGVLLERLQQIRAGGFHGASLSDAGAQCPHVPKWLPYWTVKMQNLPSSWKILLDSVVLEDFQWLDELLLTTITTTTIMIIVIARLMVMILFTICRVCTIYGTLYIYYLVPTSHELLLGRCIYSHFANENS